MLYVLIAIVLAFAFSVFLFQLGDKGYQGFHTAMAIIGIVGGLASLAGLLLYAAGVYFWYAAGVQATIVNRQYGTSYTREEIFYASSVIDEIRQLERKRIELNGNILRERSDESR